jgi:hypothetical protein
LDYVKDSQLGRQGGNLRTNTGAVNMNPPRRCGAIPASHREMLRAIPALEPRVERLGRGPGVLVE